MDPYAVSCSGCSFRRELRDGSETLCRDLRSWEQSASLWSGFETEPSNQTAGRGPCISKDDGAVRRTDAPRGPYPGVGPALVV